MASIFFEQLNGVVSESSLTMHSLLATSEHSSSVTINDSQDCCSSGNLPLDDSDVYQCGKCKKLYTSFFQFINHKKLHGPSNINREEEAKRSLDNPLVLSDTDILSFSIDQNVLNSHVLTAVPTHSLFPTTDSSMTNLELSHQENSLAESIFSNEMNDGKEETLFNSSSDSNQLFVSSGSGNYLTTSPLLSTIQSGNAADNTLTVSIVEVTPPNNDNDCDNIINVDSTVKTDENISKPDEKAEQKKKDCPYCSKTFVRNFDLEQHIRSHTGERPFQCVICGQAFRQKSHVSKHMISHKVWPERESTLIRKDSQENSSESSEFPTINASQYHCEFCPAVFTNYLCLRNHRAKNHLDRKVYRCIQEKCNWTSPTLESFLEHLSVHNNEATYSCRICSKIFTSLDEYGVHQYYHEISPAPTVPKTHTCKKCKRKFSSKEGLNIHLKRDSHRYPCPICNKEFMCDRFLRKHVVVHNKNAQTFKCTVCDKEFQQAQYLASHKKIHSSEKPFNCPQCPMRFVRNDLLNRHLLTHDTQSSKKFKCSFYNFLGCEREFNRKDKLKEHIATHYKQNIQVVNNTCDVCRKDFKSASMLARHKNKCVSNQQVKDSENKLVNAPSKAASARKRVYKKQFSAKCNKFCFNSNITRELDDNVPTIEIVVMPVGKSLKGGRAFKKSKSKKLSPSSESDFSHILNLDMSDKPALDESIQNVVS